MRSKNQSYYLSINKYFNFTSLVYQNKLIVSMLQAFYFHISFSLNVSFKEIFINLLKHTKMNKTSIRDNNLKSMLAVILY